MQPQPVPDGSPTPLVLGASEAAFPDFPPVPPRLLPRSWRKLLAPALCCVAAGLLISLLPILLLLEKGQPPVWVADSDELLYLAVAAQSYFEHPFHLADPIVQGHPSRCMFPWIQFAPGILPAYFLHLGPLAISFFWRVFAGFSMGLGIFLVIWKMIRRPWMAAAFTVWMLSDAGMVTGQPFFQQFAGMIKLASAGGDYVIAGEPQIMRLWRIITPGLSLVYLLFFLFALLHLKASPSRRSTVFAGIAFGLLFYVYFYFWTAAALALLICAVLEKGLRRSCILAGLIGCVIGIPAIVSGFLLKNSVPYNWLRRTDNFVHVPHTSDLHWFPVPDCLLMISLFWVLKRRRDLLPVWALAFSGMVLIDHQVITGMQIQNYHYLYVFGPVFSLLVIGAFAAAAMHFEQRRPWLVRFCVAGLCFGSLFSGLWLRSAEADRTEVPLKLQADVKRYRSQRQPTPGDAHEDSIPRLVRDSVVAGDSMFLYLAPVMEDQRPLTCYAVLFSPAVSDQEWDRREALNAYLIGRTLREFDGLQREFFQAFVYGPPAHDMSARARQIENRDREFVKIMHDPETALNDFNVRYIALAGDQGIPDVIASQFHVLQNGPAWVIWERNETATRKPETGKRAPDSNASGGGSRLEANQSAKGPPLPH